MPDVPELPPLVLLVLPPPLPPLLLLLLPVVLVVLVPEVATTDVPELVVAVVVDADPVDAEACPEDDELVSVVLELDDAMVAEVEAALCEAPELDAEEAALGDEKQPVATESTRKADHHSERACIDPSGGPRLPHGSAEWQASPAPASVVR